MIQKPSRWEATLPQRLVFFGEKDGAEGSLFPNTAEEIEPVIATSAGS